MTSAGVRVRAANRLTRIVLCLLGLVTIGWGGSVLPLFWQEASPDLTATKILQGDTFNVQWLRAEARQAVESANDPSCNPAALRDLVILRVAIFNESITKDSKEIADSAYDPLYDATRKALSCAPSDAFAWLTLFWLDVVRHGLNPGNANYLRLSYTLGPNEGSIALWRNRLAFLLYQQLPADLADDAINEFVKLVNTEQLSFQTAAIFENVPPVARSRIVEGLKGTTEVARRRLARVLRDDGFDVDIPGIAKPEARPWR